jgi:hypothetical protein
MTDSKTVSLTCTEGHAIQPAALEYVERLRDSLAAAVMRAVKAEIEVEELKIAQRAQGKGSL